MSRVAKSPIELPKGVDVSISGLNITVKGGNGQLYHTIPACVGLENNDGVLTVTVADESKSTWAHAGTTRALLNNMVLGVSKGFEKRLTLVGVGYRAQAKCAVLDLTLGFSHPVQYPAPEGITIETPSQTEVVIKGIDKQKVGQTAAEIRMFRPPEPYKGKGVRYSDEQITLKEAKKK
jgi:large subunit ribosomal protein L6